MFWTITQEDFLQERVINLLQPSLFKKKLAKSTMQCKAVSYIRKVINNFTQTLKKLF